MKTITGKLPLWTLPKPDGTIGGWTQERLLKEFEGNRNVARRMFGGQSLDLSNMTYAPVDSWAKIGRAHV